MVKHTQAIRRLLLTNCLSVFHDFVGLVLKGLNYCGLFLNFSNMYLQMEEVGNVIFPYLTLRSKNHTIFSLRASWILESEMNSGDLNADCIKRGKKLLQVITEEQTTLHR